MSKQKWAVKGHSYAIADTGDYDGYWEITNGSISLMTQDDPDDDVLLAIADALNKSECDFYVDDSHVFVISHLNQELEQLKAENSKMRQALEEISGTVFNISDRATAMTMRSIATEALKTT